MSEESARLKAIVGTWKSDSVVEGRFERFMVMTFTGDGRVITNTESTNIHTGRISGLNPMEGTYKVSDGIIHRNIDGSKAEIPYSIRGATMRLILGREFYALRRQAWVQE